MNRNTKKGKSKYYELKKIYHENPKDDDACFRKIMKSIESLKYAQRVQLKIEIMSRMEGNKSLSGVISVITFSTTAFLTVLNFVLIEESDIGYKNFMGAFLLISTIFTLYIIAAGLLDSSKRNKYLLECINEIDSRKERKLNRIW